MENHWTETQGKAEKRKCTTVSKEGKYASENHANEQEGIPQDNVTLDIYNCQQVKCFQILEEEWFVWNVKVECIVLIVNFRVARQ